MSIIFVVTLNLQQIDKFSIRGQKLIPYDNGVTDQNSTTENNSNQARRGTEKCVRISLDGYCFSCIRNLLEMSPTYRKRITDYCKLSRYHNLKIHVTLVEPHEHIMDYKW